MLESAAVAATNVYGVPPAALAEVSPDAAQFSPVMVGSDDLGRCGAGSLADLTMLAPPGTLERRFALAQALRALAPRAPFTVLAPKDLGGSRLAGDLAAFGCLVDSRAKRHHRICSGLRPDAPLGLDAALAEGGPRLVDGLGLWSQPGVFSWNRIDPGSALLLGVLPHLAGEGADLGCGIGVLAHGVLASPDVVKLHLLEVDRRAVDLARRNVDDPRVEVAWRDVRSGTGLANLDFVVMNPPFHESGADAVGLGRLFIQRAAEALRGGGQLWLTANRHLPYEGALKPLFRRVTPIVEADGFKVVSATR